MLAKPGCWTLVCALLLLSLRPEQSAASNAEDRVKTAITFKITRFITWPTAVDRITLCALGTDEFIDTLKSMTGKVSKGRKIEVLEQSARSKISDQCNILYLDNTNNDTTQRILNYLKGKPVLTISDREGFAEQGGIVGLFRSEKKIRFAINLKSTREAGLVISSQLLNLAKIIQ